MTAGRGVAPAGLAMQVRHSGGAGAPPGSTRRPCQELAYSFGYARLVFARRVAFKCEARPAAGQRRNSMRSLSAGVCAFFDALSLSLLERLLARREAPAVVLYRIAEP